MTIACAFENMHKDINSSTKLLMIFIIRKAKVPVMSHIAFRDASAMS